MDAGPKRRSGSGVSTRVAYRLFPDQGHDCRVVLVAVCIAAIEPVSGRPSHCYEARAVRSEGVVSMIATRSGGNVEEPEHRRLFHHSGALMIRTLLRCEEGRMAANQRAAVPAWRETLFLARAASHSSQRRGCFRWNHRRRAVMIGSEWTTAAGRARRGRARSIPARPAQVARLRRDELR